ncbi:TraB/GumN family protein [Comamonas humi]
MPLALIHTAQAAIKSAAKYLAAAACACLLLGPGLATAEPCPPPLAPLSPQEVQRLQRQEHPDRGVLWELSKGAQRGYLLGTIHVGQPEWLFPGPRTRQALRQAPAIALELDPADPATLQALLEMMRHESDVQKLILRHNPRLVARMDALAQQACVALPQFQTLGVVGKVLTLTMLSAQQDGYRAEYGVDLMLAAAARAARKPVKALETAQEQLEALGAVRSNRLADAATPQELDKVLTRIEDGTYRRQMQALAQDWSSGDLRALDELMRNCDCLDELDMKASLLDERNQRMARRIPALLDDYPGMVIAVGLLHMVGDGSLLQQLQAQGYAVRQLTGKGAEAAATPR